MAELVPHVPSFEPCVHAGAWGSTTFTGYRGTCSCGWKGALRGKKKAAIAEAVWHATHQGEGEAA